jgi:hypothetical protein
MKRKTRKFASGGDIITGLGAVLVGKALYDKYKEGKGKDDDESDYAKKVREFRGSKKDTTETTPEPAKKEEDKPMSREEYLEKRGAKPIKETGTFKGPDTAEPDLEYKSKSVVKTTPKKAAPAAQSTKTEPRSKAIDKVGAGYENVGKKSSKSVVFKDATTSTPKASAPAEAPAKIGSQGSFKFDSKPDLSVPKAFDMKSGNKTVYGTDTTSVFQKQAARARAEAEEKAKKKEKDAAQAKEFRERSLQPMKKGGMVKKYASGGTTTSKPEPKKDTMPDWAKNERANRKQDELNKREAEGARKEVKRNMSTFGFKKGGSASSRADGIAIRGKTRA